MLRRMNFPEYSLRDDLVFLFIFESLVIGGYRADVIPEGSAGTLRQKFIGDAQPDEHTGQIDRDPRNVRDYGGVCDPCI